MVVLVFVQGGSNMTGTNCDLFTHKQSRSYLNHLALVTRGGDDGGDCGGCAF
jgi:hypothetical protein